MGVARKSERRRTASSFPLSSFSLPAYSLTFSSSLSPFPFNAAVGDLGSAKRFCAIFNANLRIVHARTDAILFFRFKFYTAVVQISHRSLRLYSDCDG